MPRSRRSKFQKLIDSKFTWPVVGGAAVLVGALFVFSTFSGAGMFGKAQLVPGMPSAGTGNTNQNSGQPTTGINMNTQMFAFAASVVGGNAKIQVQITPPGAKMITETCDPLCGGLTGANATKYPLGTVMNLTAQPDKGYGNPTWTGSGNCAGNPGGEDVPFGLSQDTNCKLTVQDLTYTVTVKLTTTDGKGVSAGAVYAAPVYPSTDRINCQMDDKGQSGPDCTLKVTPDILLFSVSLNAFPKTPGFKLDHWQGGGCEYLNSKSGSPVGTQCAVAKGSDVTVTVFFAPVPAYTLSLDSYQANTGGFYNKNLTFPVNPTTVTGSVDSNKIDCTTNAKGTKPTVGTCDAKGTAGLNSFTINAMSSSTRHFFWDCGNSLCKNQGATCTGTLTADTVCVPSWI